MFVAEDVPLSFLFLILQTSFQMMYICYHVFYCTVSIFTYPTTCAVDVIDWMYFHCIVYTYAFACAIMYLLFLYDLETLYLELKLINLKSLNVTQRKGTLEELKLYL